MRHPHILILGGTTEARAIATRLAADVPGLKVTTSLAGRTGRPVTPPGELRVGGFGGPEGLARWIETHEVKLLIDATHPFAARISANARLASAHTGVPAIMFERPEWRQREGDDWIDAGTMEAAAGMLGAVPRRVFLAVGRQELAPFAAHPMHSYVVRSVDALPGGILPDAVRMLGRGPFDEAAERRLLAEHGIEVVVAKNSGGEATYGKIAAARALGLPVVVVRRPASPARDACHSVDAVMEAVHQALARLEERGA